MDKKLILIVEDSEESYENLLEQILEESKNKDEIETDWAQSYSEAQDFVDDNEKDYYMFIIDRNIPQRNESSPEGNWSIKLLKYLRLQSIYGGDNKDPNWLIYSAERETINSLLNDDAFSLLTKDQTYIKGDDDFIEKFDSLFKKGSDKNKIYKETIGASYKTIGNMLGNDGRKKMLRVARIIVDTKKEDIDIALGVIRNIRNNLAKEHRRKTGLSDEKFTIKGLVINIIDDYGILKHNNYLYFLEYKRILDKQLNSLLFFHINQILNTYGSHEGEDDHEGEDKLKVPDWVNINMVRVCFHAVAALAEVLYEDHKKRERSQAV